MSEKQKKCDIEAPGHNLPAKLRLGKLRRIKNSKTRLELDGDHFRLHRSCRPIRVGCGNPWFINVDSETFWPVNHKSDRECFCFSIYVTHDPEDLIATLNESGWSNFQEVKSRNLKGLILYFESSKKYFWLREYYDFDFGGVQVCSGDTKIPSNQTSLPTSPSNSEEFSELQN